MKKILKVIAIIIVIVLIVSLMYSCSTKRAKKDLTMSLMNNSNVLNVMVPFEWVTYKQLMKVFMMEDDYGRTLIIDTHRYVHSHNREKALKTSLVYITQKIERNKCHVINYEYFDYIEFTGKAEDFFSEGLSTSNEKYKAFLIANRWNQDPKDNPETIEISIEKKNYFIIPTSDLRINAEAALLELSEEIYILYESIAFSFGEKKLIYIIDEYGRNIIGFHYFIDGEEVIFVWCLQTSNENSYTYLPFVAFAEIDLYNYREDMSNFMRANNWNKP